MRDSRPTKNVSFCLIGLSRKEGVNESGQSVSTSGCGFLMVHNGAPHGTAASEGAASKGATKML